MTSRTYYGENTFFNNNWLVDNNMKSQNKQVSITSNGTTVITPDQGYDGMAMVTANVNVQAQPTYNPLTNISTSISITYKYGTDDLYRSYLASNFIFANLSNINTFLGALTYTNNLTNEDVEIGRYSIRTNNSIAQIRNKDQIIIIDLQTIQGLTTVIKANYFKIDNTKSYTISADSNKRHYILVIELNDNWMSLLNDAPSNSEIHLSLNCNTLSGLPNSLSLNIQLIPFETSGNTIPNLTQNNTQVNPTIYQFYEYGST